MEKCRIAVAKQGACLAEGERSSCLGSIDCAGELYPDYRNLDVSHLLLKMWGEKRDSLLDREQ